MRALQKTIRFSTPLLVLVLVLLTMAAWGGQAFCLPIHDAAKACDAPRVRALLDEDPGLVSSRDTLSRTPLHLAAKKGCKEVDALLLDRGADVDARDKNGITPFQHACWQGDMHLVKLFLAHGASVRTRDNYGCDPLYFASVQGHRDVAGLLLDKGANANAKSNDGTTSLHIAAQQGYTDVAEELLARGADVRAVDSIVQTPLHYAAKTGRKEAAEMLLSHGADIEARDDTGNTPLHYAAWRGRKGIAELLLSRGADVHAKNLHGFTPLCYAAWQGHADVEELLLSRGAGLSVLELVFSRSPRWDAHLLDVELLVFVIVSLLPSLILFLMGKRREGVSSAAVMLVLDALLFTPHPGVVTYLVLLAGSFLWLIQIPYIALLLIGAEIPLGKKRTPVAVQEAGPVIPSAPLTPGGQAPRETVSKTTMLLVTAVIAVAGMAAAAAAGDASGRLTAVECMLAGLACVFVVDLLLEKRRKRERETADASRAARLIETITGRGIGVIRPGAQGRAEEAVVHGSSGVVNGCLGVLVALLLGGFMCAGKGSPPPIVSVLAAVPLLLGVLAILKAIPSLGGKPILRLSGRGLHSPAYGFIPWGEVQGVCMRGVDYRGLAIGKLIDFHVPRLKEHAGQFHPVIGFLCKFGLGAGSKNRVISILLRKTDESPETIYQVARRLWRESTGRDTVWYPGMPPEVGEAWERLGRYGAQALDELRRAYRHGPGQYGKLAKAYGEALKDKPATGNDLKIVRKDASRLARNQGAAIAIGIIIGLKLSKMFG